MSVSQSRSATLSVSLPYPQAHNGEEAGCEKAKEDEQRPAELDPERAGADRGEPEPEGGPGPHAEQFPHCLQNKGYLPTGHSGRHEETGHVLFGSGPHSNMENLVTSLIADISPYLCKRALLVGQVFWGESK